MMEKQTTVQVRRIQLYLARLTGLPLGKKVSPANGRNLISANVTSIHFKWQMVGIS